MMTAMTRALRTIGIPATVLVLAACGSNETSGGPGGESPQPPPATSTPSTSPASPTPSATPTTSATTPPGTPTPDLPTPTGPATRPTPGQGPHGPDPSRADFPLTLVRIGGIAGFHDKVVLQADGSALVVRKGRAPDRCRVASGLMDQIHAALGVTSWPAPGQSTGGPPGRMSDQMFVKVISGRHHASLDDPALTKLSGPLSKLLGDITQPAGQRTYCT